MNQLQKLIRNLLRALFLSAFVLLGAPLLHAQTPASNETQLGLKLAEAGKCTEALPHLRKAHPTTSELKMDVGNWGVRCAMQLNQSDAALDFLSGLRHAFPRDPAVQFLAVHVYSDLSIRASQEMLFTNPGAYQVHQLNAESLETQGRWDDAMAEYKAVLEKNPQLPGIHYRIGRLILSKPQTKTTFEEAQKEFEAELAVDPHNAGAEYVLGELARQQDQWPEAIAHFRKATELDNNFADAFLGLGRSLTAAGKSEEAIAPLERAVELQPANPATHFHLATALRHAGKEEESKKEFALYQQASERAAQMKHNVQQGVLGPQGVSPADQQ